MLLLADDEPQASLEHGRDLLLRMGMAGDTSTGAEMNPGDRHRLGMDELAPDRGRQLVDRIV